MENPKAPRHGPEEPASGAFDLTPFLSAWEYDESKSVRRVRASDGREVLQVRLPLGLEQYEIDGRPDGKRPMDQESWLHHYSRKARATRQGFGPGSATRDSMAWGPWSSGPGRPGGGPAEGSPPESAREAFPRPTDDTEASSGGAPRREPFLKDEDFIRLHQEGLLYYYRYLLFFQIQEYRLCARDTRRNLRLLDFVADHARPDLAEQLEQYRPYIVRMHVMSRALERIQRTGEVRYALRLLREGRKTVEALEPIPGNQVFEWEKARALVSLDDLVSQLEAQIPVPRREQLRRQLEAAIQEEDYEKAAVLRDQIARLRKRSRS